MKPAQKKDPEFIENKGGAGLRVGKRTVGSEEFCLNVSPGLKGDQAYRVVTGSLGRHLSRGEARLHLCFGKISRGEGSSHVTTMHRHPRAADLLAHLTWSTD